MPERETLLRARRDKREGKAASTQAGEFIREEMHHIREGVHGARSSRQAIAIGLSKARRAGVERDNEGGHGAASPEALSAQAHAAANRRGHASLLAAARKMARAKDRRARSRSS
jgi:hypothetical protein